MGQTKTGRATKTKKGGAWETLKKAGVTPKEVPPNVKKEALAKTAAKNVMKKVVIKDVTEDMETHAQSPIREQGKPSTETRDHVPIAAEVSSAIVKEAASPALGSSSPASKPQSPDVMLVAAKKPTTAEDPPAAEPLPPAYAASSDDEATEDIVRNASQPSTPVRLKRSKAAELFAEGRFHEAIEAFSNTITSRGRSPPNESPSRSVKTHQKKQSEGKPGTPESRPRRPSTVQLELMAPANKGRRNSTIALAPPPAPHDPLQVGNRRRAKSTAPQPEPFFPVFGHPPQQRSRANSHAAPADQTNGGRRGRKVSNAQRPEPEVLTPNWIQPIPKRERKLSNAPPPDHTEPIYLAPKGRRDSDEGFPDYSSVATGRRRKPTVSEHHQPERAGDGFPNYSTVATGTGRRKPTVSENHHPGKRNGGGHSDSDEDRYVNVNSVLQLAIPTDTDPRVFTDLALCHIRLGQFQQAIDCCTKSILLDEKYVKAWLRRSEARRDAGDLPGALSDARKVQQLVNEWMDHGGAVAMSPMSPTSPKSPMSDSSAAHTPPPITRRSAARAVAALEQQIADDDTAPHEVAQIPRNIKQRFDELLVVFEQQLAAPATGRALAVAGDSAGRIANVLYQDARLATLFRIAGGFERVLQPAALSSNGRSLALSIVLAAIWTSPANRREMAKYVKEITAALENKDDLVAVSVAAKVVAICVSEDRFVEEMVRAKGKGGEEARRAEEIDT
ncbi:hypothetical protein M427DRAFT_43559 [Gonapodya prolifera JEL478]|uniref:Uncharacterized protein n=1 Tax=Gonapodya prolifera (strain JEL478) TaxID=1344416 RepID=A0A139AJ94_GONPJ|nr:hypothetical protein M427DRAFT_43559 [Gonapodya prolifera JEL478]|eukprot:KXS16475.1 hypothetical protein M427DRAFT_43559 [Gonapodya prolifera JEL478]